MIIKLDNLKCEDCPALGWIDRQLPKISKWDIIREKIAKNIPSINLYLLGESMPYSRFIYDKHTDYSRNGLRFNLREELVGNGSDDDLFDYLRQKGILFVDCALCPLHKLNSLTDKILAATFCLQRNNLPYLHLNSDAPIITIFPYRRGYAQNSIPEVDKRVVARFQFIKLTGLKDVIENYL
ncbi:MAG: hypothetical protein QQN41_06070, partial [Nitrosopumilus sp.]